MITGSLNARCQMVIRLEIRNSSGQAHFVEAILDSGFTGSLTLPVAVISALGLTFRSRSTGVLANGAVQHFDQYSAIVIWDGRPRAIVVTEIDAVPLLGMRLLIGHDLRARIAVGGSLEIEAIP